jgi:hypothetical protein
MSEQVIPSAVAQRIVVKFLTNENAKPAEILMRPRAQFDNETLSRTEVHACSVHLKKARQRLKTCEGFIFCRGSYGQRFWDSQGTLFIDFLIEQRTINAAYYSKLLKD